ncbi:MAG: acetyl-CoA carboxylase biotin carboxylase subunit [Gammaproteobacteria bacterium]|nr:acetyl-CoA carboxylase biotin carboxylase subunit [Gammaproteobacteria bacterium]MCP5200000.1 acetyl-CoA carboxylase biotin carboxylase subunit [Gammaproteobacteria bacterium]
MSIASVFIANRGEIAVRINRACRELGLRVVQAASAADLDSLAARLADEVVEIGPPPAAKSYLDIERVVAAARDSGCDAVHPGYGFLAENADFADAVVAAGMRFIGPSGDAIRLLGDKVEARRVAQAAGVPVVPGSDGRLDTLEEATALAAQIGYPVMIKAAAGGGGRGIRIVHDAAELARQFPQASGEARAAFGDGGLYVEKVIEHARHVEVQLLGDGERFVHCYERECSLQRRRQKVWEEAPAFGLDQALRERLCASAVALAAAVHYRGAGTVEYLYDPRTHEFYFIEVNTRIQVEHPVTEMITGIDLVATMIRIAGGEPLPFAQDQVRPAGHAIECRINAEDPARNFMPGPGTVTALTVPQGEGVRFDTLLYAGYAVPPFYDSLLGKLIVHGPDRDTCLERLRDALAGLDIVGLATTRGLHEALARDADVIAGRTDTRFLEPWLAREFVPAAAP